MQFIIITKYLNYFLLVISITRNLGQLNDNPSTLNALWSLFTDDCNGNKYNIDILPNAHVSKLLYKSTSNDNNPSENEVIGVHINDSILPSIEKIINQV